MNSSVDSAAIDTRSIKTIVGALALIAAVAAAAAGMTVAASLFGALTALSLSAAAGLAASLELLDSDHHRLARAALWATLMAAWFVLAAMLFNLPLLHLAGLRLLTSALLVGGAALRVDRWRAQHEPTPPGLVVALALVPLALILIWSGRSMAVATAVCIGCAVELFGTGGFWLGEFFASRRPAPKQTHWARASATAPMA
jgi:hypothetical protein